MITKLELVNPLMMLDIKDLSIEFNEGSSTFSYPHYRIRCADEDLSLLAASLYDLNLQCEVCSKNERNFLLIEKNILDELIKKSDFIERFAFALARNKAHSSPKMQPVERIETGDISKLVDLRSGFRRVDRHIESEVVILKLYHFGASLINSGNLYSDSPMEITDLDEGESIEKQQTSKSDTQNAIMAAYNNLPAKRKNNGSLYPVMHILFVLSVALDHLGAKFILDVVNKLGIDGAQKTMNSYITVEFPDGTKIIEHAVDDILHLYILNNLHRFSHLFSDNDKACYETLATGIAIQFILDTLHLRTEYNENSGDINREAIAKVFKPSTFINVAPRVEVISEEENNGMKL